ADEIVGAAVAQEVGNRRVKVGAPINDQHVVDQIIDVHQKGIIRIAGAVGIVALDSLIAVGGGRADKCRGLRQQLGVGRSAVGRAAGQIKRHTTVFCN